MRAASDVVGCFWAGRDAMGVPVVVNPITMSNVLILLKGIPYLLAPGHNNITGNE